MIAPIKNTRCSDSEPTWHAAFMAMLPSIARHANIVFRHMPPEPREEAIQEVVANALVAFVRLVELGKTDIAYPSALARYGVAQVRSGRTVGTPLNCHDVSSRYAQIRKGIRVTSLDRFDHESGEWKEAVIQDTRRASVPDIVSFRVDFTDWLNSLRNRDRQVTEELAVGERTSDVAYKFNLSSSRVSQLRRDLHRSWEAFTGDRPERAQRDMAFA